jgi:endonuclease G
MCPSADRTSTPEDNDVTFSMANMLPQTPDLNRYLWKTFESFCRRLVAQGNELYIVAGGYGSLDVIGGYGVTVPTHVWKIVVVVPQGGGVRQINVNTRVIALYVPNSFGIKGNAWQKYITTVDAVEKATGYNFLSNVPTGVQAVIESRLDSGK